MNFRIAFAPAFPAARTLAVIAATATFALATVAVHAQTPPPAAPASAAGGVLAAVCAVREGLSPMATDSTRSRWSAAIVAALRDNARDLARATLNTTEGALLGFALAILPDGIFPKIDINAPSKRERHHQRR